MGEGNARRPAEAILSFLGGAPAPPDDIPARSGNGGRAVDEIPPFLDGRRGAEDDDDERGARAAAASSALPGSVPGGPPDAPADGDARPPSAGGAPKAEADAGEILAAWSPSTTRLLLPPAAPPPSPSPSPSSPPLPGPSFDVLDGALGIGFARDLRSELEGAGLLRDLRPARTASDARAEEVLGVLGGFVGGDEAGRGAPAAAGPRARGDMSTFVSRGYRSGTGFAARHPLLRRLVASVRDTAMRRLGGGEGRGGAGGRIEFDPSLTSVQVAVFPGDGVSRYVRHCDAGPMCASEDAPPPPGGEEAGKMGRILTAIYYLTDPDWDPDLDGGCLRVYPPRSSAYPMEAAVSRDIAPMADRMVLLRSDLVEHEVLPSLRRERTAVTVWVYGRIVPGKERNAVNERHASGGSTISSSENHIAAAPAKHKPAGTAASVPRTGPPLLPLSPADPPREGRGWPRIFVAIPSYRDPETHPTILSLVSSATRPGRVFVGVVWQVDTRMPGSDSACCDPPLPADWADSNLRSLTLDRRHATGPAHARALAQNLHRGEEYVLQIDSHMRFRQGWDEYLIWRLNMCPHPERAVITAYPPGYELPNKVPADARGTLLVPWKFDGDGMLRQRGRRLRAMPPGTENIPCNLYAAGFAFSSASVLAEVPYDPTLHHLFFGEEMSMAVRLFTSGYDLYAPPEAVCFHLWNRDYRKTVQSDRGGVATAEARGGGGGARPTDGPGWAEASRARSQAAVRAQLLGDPSQLRRGHLGLRTERTSAEFATRIGVDFEARTIAPGAERGGLDAAAFADSEGGGGLATVAGGVGERGGGTAAEVAGLVAAFLGS